VAKFLVSAYQKYRRRRRKGSGNYSVYFIAHIRFLTNCHDTENYLLFPDYVVFHLCRLNGEESVVSSHTAEPPRERVFPGNDKQSRNIFIV
jgi:hypothetical protein